MAHASAVKKWKNAVTQACKLAGVCRPSPDDKDLNYGIVWYHKTKICPDADNVVAMLKSTIDGIFAHFGVDDEVADINGVRRFFSNENCVAIIFDSLYGSYDLCKFMSNPVVRKKRTAKKNLDN